MQVGNSKLEMKPALKMDEKMAPIIIQSPELEREQVPRERHWIAQLCFSVIFMCLVVTASFGIIFFHQAQTMVGQNTNHDEYVELDVAFHIEDTDEIVNEHILVNDREEDITTPTARLIFDYQNGIVVTKIIYDENVAPGGDVCFVAEFDTELGIEQVREAARYKGCDVVAKMSETEEIYVSKDTVVDVEMLSPRSKEMCHGHVLVMAKKIESKLFNGPLSFRHKRGYGSFGSAYAYCTQGNVCYHNRFFGGIGSNGKGSMRKS